MVALMEMAGARLMNSCLGADELSVGVSVEVTHTSPTPKGATVIAEGCYLGREGKLFLFEVVASDQGGEIGRGRHKRAIVSTERLQDGAIKRNL
jgi:predicted thioesterase